MSENLITYLVTGVLLISAVIIYGLQKSRQSHKIADKVSRAKESGFHEPVSLHPVVNHDTCIGSGACVLACPEKDILGIMNGQAVTINASRCVGHGACFHACPVGAITLVMGTEKRGVELPHVSSEFETNVPGIYIAGELGGMGLIKNAIVQGKQAVDNISKNLKCTPNVDYDLIIIGAGPAGISASLNAAKNHLRFLTLEQDTLGGTVANFPREKLVMTSPVELPLYGKIKFRETSKLELMKFWKDVLDINDIKINEQERVVSIDRDNGYFRVATSKSSYASEKILLTIGRRGSPRKLGVPGEEKDKVAYRLLEPEHIKGKNILIVGGGDSAIENAALLCEHNIVHLSYRGSSFSRIKPKNLERINELNRNNKVNLVLESNVKEILDEHVILELQDGTQNRLNNDLVFIFAGGELPSAFLEKAGIKITKKFGEAVLKNSG